MHKSANQIRKDFIKFFEDQGHTFVPSSSLFLPDDPTLLFANAGMNQFKGIFLGTETREYTRAVNTQKCIRAGGKHNDLEDVGHDCYHHTFFEMLGNWSFGDYFKAEAIEWAWKLFTEVWGLPKDRLYATVFEGDKAAGLEPDDETLEIWKRVTDIDPNNIVMAGAEDNFWEMGETGPCGVTTEIHIDLTEDGSGKALVNAGDPNVLELWNLVFMQYYRGEDGNLSPLPANHVDTGAGFERVCKVLQGKKSNYATDLFVPILEKIETMTDHRYGASSGLEDRFDVISEEDIGDVAFRVIADHARALTFAIADGIMPSNEGRGYVLRRILRRAARYGRQYLNIQEPFVVKMVPTVVEIMGDVFPEIKERETAVIETIREEEEAFGRTLDRGIALFEKEAKKLQGKGELPGEIVFDLYATYGFPVDLTELMAAERNMTIDLEGYNEAMERHREVSSAGDKFKATSILGLPPTDDSAKYINESVEANVLGWVIDNEFQNEGVLNAGDEAAVVLDKTNFYAEQGGQVGDKGALNCGEATFSVANTVPAGQCVLHVGRMEAGQIRVGDKVTACVDKTRIDTMRNHTATHLLNWALRDVLGDHVEQAGSVVAPDRLRFDFSHTKAVTPEELVEVESLVNHRVLADEEVIVKTMPLADAKKIPGVRAVFGEKYPDPVRVVSIGSETPAVEFCGGTHLTRTSQVGLFQIVSEESIAKGVRRITAVTGREAVSHVQKSDSIIRETTATLGVPAEQLTERILAMQKEIKALRKGGKGVSKSTDAETIFASDDGEIVVVLVEHCDAGAMRSLGDSLKQKGAKAIMVGGTDGEKVTLVAMVDDELAKSGKIKAGDWAKEAAAIVGGSGGGKRTMAQAGGKQPEKLRDALERAAEYAKSNLFHD